MKLRIRYVDFWPEFSAENNIFTQLLRKQFNYEVEIIYSNSLEVDLEICSVFCFKSLADKAMFRAKCSSNNQIYQDYVARTTYGYRLEYRTKARKRIWYTGENKRAPLSESFDGTLSFDKDDSFINNVYFPYWMTRIDWGFNLSNAEISPTPESLIKNRSPFPTNDAVCSFSSNTDPERERILNALSQTKLITKFGKSAGNQVESKMESARGFTFQVCNENDIYPGYVTEKLQEAWLAGNIPIWSGMHAGNEFNLDSYIDVTGCTTQEIQNKIEILTEQDIRFMQSQPLLNQVPTLDSLTEFLYRIL